MKEITFRIYESEHELMLISISLNERQIYNIIIDDYIEIKMKESQLILLYLIGKIVERYKLKI